MASTANLGKFDFPVVNRISASDHSEPKPVPRKAIFWLPNEGFSDVVSREI